MNSPAPVFAPKRKKLLTKPLLKFVVGQPLYVFIHNAMYIGKDLSKPGDEKKKEPATLVDVTSLVVNAEGTALVMGEEAQIIVNAVIKGVFHDEYANDAYVGKCFAITKQMRQPGKAYDPFKVEEIEGPPEATLTKSDSATPGAPAPARPVGGTRK